MNRPHRTGWLLPALAAVVVLLLVVGTVLTVRAESQDRSPYGAGSAGSGERLVGFHDLRIAIPTSWRESIGDCAPAADLWTARTFCGPGTETERMVVQLFGAWPAQAAFRTARTMAGVTDHPVTVRDSLGRTVRIRLFPAGNVVLAVSGPDQQAAQSVFDSAAEPAADPNGCSARYTPSPDSWVAREVQPSRPQLSEPESITACAYSSWLIGSAKLDSATSRALRSLLITTSRPGEMGDCGFSGGGVLVLSLRLADGTAERADLLECDRVVTSTGTYESGADVARDVLSDVLRRS